MWLHIAQYMQYNISKQFIEKYFTDTCTTEVWFMCSYSILATAWQLMVIVDLHNRLKFFHVGLCKLLDGAVTTGGRFCRNSLKSFMSLLAPTTSGP